MTNTNLPYWLAAVHLRGMAPRTFRRYLEQCPDIKTLFTSSRDDLLAFGIHEKHIEPLLNSDWRLIERELAWGELPGHHLVTLQDDAYPPLLKETADPPLVLYVRGNRLALLQPQIAMVGSRNPSPAGFRNAEQFAYSLGGAGYAITSGLALGIDAASHRGAIQAQGVTLAVMGAGQAHIYPSSHKPLVELIIANSGAVISEFPLHTLPAAYHFPRRNRIIAGLSMGVLMVEAALKSGSLITARFALEEGREVFAIPGSIHLAQARGCHHLIRQGAKLVETAADIVEELGALKATVASFELDKMSIKRPKLASEELQLLEQIEYAVTPLDVIILRSRLTPGEVSSILLSLELCGVVQSVTGGYMRTDPA